MQFPLFSPAVLCCISQVSIKKFSYADVIFIPFRKVQTYLFALSRKYALLFTMPLCELLQYYSIKNQTPQLSLQGFEWCRGRGDSPRPNTVRPKFAWGEHERGKVRAMGLSAHCANNSQLFAADFACSLRSRKIRIRFKSHQERQKNPTPFWGRIFFGASDGT